MAKHQPMLKTPCCGHDARWHSRYQTWSRSKWSARRPTSWCGLTWHAASTWPPTLATNRWITSNSLWSHWNNQWDCLDDSCWIPRTVKPKFASICTKLPTASTRPTACVWCRPITSRQRASFTCSMASWNPPSRPSPSSSKKNLISPRSESVSFIHSFIHIQFL